MRTSRPVDVIAVTAARDQESIRRAVSQGVAQYLVGVMEQLARRDFAARELRVSCFNDNSAGLLLYARLGYRLSGLVERQRGQHRVALVQFVKELGS